MAFTNIFNTKIIYYETESDGAPFVAPEARRGERLIVARSIEFLGEDIIGKLPRLRKTVYAFAYLEVYPTTAIKLVEIVCENSFFLDIRKADMRVIIEIKRGAQVEAGDVEGGKPGIRRDRKLLTRSLAISKEPVGVTTFPG